MTCEEAQRLLDAYTDGELDLARTLEIEQHIGACAACSDLYAERRALRSALRGSAAALYYSAPDALQRRLADAVRRERREQRAAARPVGMPVAWRRWSGFGPLSTAAALSLALFAVLLHLRTSAVDADAALAQQVVSSHVRSLMASHLTDVPTSDKHTVKPWFNGKLDFSPDVPDLKAEGYPLVGGRLDDLAGRPVAALVYHRNRHMINVFVWPAPGTPAAQSASPQSEGTYRGYHVLRWTASGMVHWAASDLNEPELRDFVMRFCQAESAGG